MKTWKVMVAASALALATGAASASTYKFQISTDWNPGPGFESVDLTAPATPGITVNGGQVAATAFDVTATEYVGNVATTNIKNFIAWCLDISKSAFGSQLRTETNDFGAVSIGADKAVDAATNMQRLFDSAYDNALDSKVSSAAFQVALWEILYDGDLKLDAGIFQASENAAVVDAAQALLDNLGSGPRKYTLTFYTSASNQDVVTATPIPLPATGLLLLGAFAGIGAAARRKARANA